jgi:hypothetical protein
MRASAPETRSLAELPAKVFPFVALIPRGQTMRRSERNVTGLLWPWLDELKEKSRDQICADCGNQRSTRKT